MAIFLWLIGINQPQRRDEYLETKTTDRIIVIFPFIPWFQSFYDSIWFQPADHFNYFCIQFSGCVLIPCWWLWTSVLGHFDFGFVVAEAIVAIIFGNFVWASWRGARTQRLTFCLHNICTQSGHIDVDLLTFGVAALWRCDWSGFLWRFRCAFTECTACTQSESIGQNCTRHHFHFNYLFPKNNL